MRLWIWRWRSMANPDKIPVLPKLSHKVRSCSVKSRAFPLLWTMICSTFYQVVLLPKYNLSFCCSLTKQWVRAALKKQWYQTGIRRDRNCFSPVRNQLRNQCSQTRVEPVPPKEKSIDFFRFTAASLQLPCSVTPCIHPNFVSDLKLTA